MQCPVCQNVTLVMSERQGIEIDYCPNCRGVWLDRGELDKIIDKSAALAAPGVASAASAASDPYRQPQPYPTQPGQHPQGGYYKKRKRDGFLGDLFDFD
ncbi:zf-TFIIB domain-containing protein [Piscinibacter koreensis]|uniref:Zf-TFIIB domain-containing protein n=1 Tax=Piscinibacter koreensis TaxID=2742824 RepID=A0A7Y6NPG7_9BURK|nr:zf-TFIIB domain-containing protein [Schlegelella koreensis]NUZ06915.1 zf-TFIIB domain-containing protein [Schlegelella koreensis]